MIFFKVLHRFLMELYSFLICLFYKICGSVFFVKLSWNVKFYGVLRFGSIGNRNIFVGKGCWFGKGCFFAAAKKAFIKMGDRSTINTGGHVVAAYGIEIGSDVMIGEYVSIRDQNHKFDDINTPMIDQGMSGKTIKICNNVWIGRGVYIGPGVEIGEGVIVGANSVVTKSVTPYTIVGGVPAKEIRKRQV